MNPLGLVVRRRSITAAIRCTAMLAGRLLVVAAVVSTTLIGVWPSPASADVTSVSGGAFGYYVNVGLFGGPRGLQGYGQTESDPPTGAQNASRSPSVALPAEGSANPITAYDPNGAKAQYGPAVIFGGLWPEDLGGAPPSGPISVSTQGTAGAGSVTSSAEIALDSLPEHDSDPTQPGSDGPGGIGPGPLTADKAQSTCTATESGVTGSVTFTNGILETKYDSVSQLPIVTEPIPVNPPPNYTRSGTIDHVGDRFTIVFNEQVLSPGGDSITVNAAHMYLLGDVARGDMVVGSTTCSLTSTTLNTAPVAVHDSFSTAGDTPLNVAAPGVLGNDTDAQGNPLTATSAQAVFNPGVDPVMSSDDSYTFPSDPANGTATINPDGSFTYTPDAGFVGTDEFQYVARDARGASATGLVAITVTPTVTPNQPPVAGDDSYATSRDTRLTTPPPGVLGNDSDADGDSLSAGSPSAPANGTVALAADGSFIYTPNPGFKGTDTFTYTASDGNGGTDTATVTITVEAGRPPAPDFDGDGDTDRSVFRNGAWYAQGQPTAYFGVSGDIPVPGDYNGDGITDRAVFRNGAWHIQGQPTVFLGNSTDIPVPGDYDGDGDTEPAVFRNGAWHIQGQPTVFLGNSTDIPVPGDYDANGTTEPAVYRNGAWHIQGQATVFHGVSGDIPVPGDYDGDRSTDPAVYRNGAWYVAGQPTVFLGNSTDIPVPGDYDANGTTDPAVYRNGAWHIQGQPTAYLGVKGDIPLPLPHATYRTFF